MDMLFHRCIPEETKNENYYLFTNKVYKVLKFMPTKKGNNYGSPEPPLVKTYFGDSIFFHFFFTP